MSGSSSSAVTPRPRPPGARKASNRSTITRGALEVQQGGLLAPSSAVAPQRRASGSSARLDCDLDLDLPSDLTTAALERSPHVWPLGARRSSQPGSSSVDDGSAKVRQDVGSLSRSVGHKASRELLEAALDATQLTSASSGRHLYSEGETSPEAFKHGELAPEATPSAAAAAAVHHEADSSGELDEEWVGGLPREELEQLLMQANHVIRERERDLGIAAAIGKALLEKNMSLRTKHNGIVTRLESVANLHEAANAAPQLYSPPTTDVDANSQRGDDDDDEDDNATPMPGSHDSDYFAGARSDPAVAEMAAAGPSSRHLSTPQRGQRAALPSHWQPSFEGLVPSAPPSPSASFRSQAPSSSSQRRGVGHQRTASGAAAAAAAAEAQRQLAVLSSQNDTLVAQLTELQYEAEEAKRDGGRRVRKLNKEIDGLRGELDAAVERNQELEQAEAEARSGGPGSAQKPKLWRRRSRNDVWGSSTSLSSQQQQSPHKPALPMPSGASTSSLAERPTLSALLAADRMSQSGSVAGHSEAGSIAGGALESLLGYAPGDTPGERAIVAQLMSKIKELEDTNAMLAKASTDVDGRLGRALQEGERIRDAYDVVEASSNAGMDEYAHTQSPSLGGGEGLSPAALRRRAAGNRHMIEGRKTIRAALRREAAINSLMENGGGGLSRSGTSSSLASTVSSAASSPRSARRTRVGLPTSTGLIRPRILITPSMEDLAARRRQDEEWEEEQHPMRQSSADWLNPADAQRAALMRHAAGAGGSRSLRRAPSADSMASSAADDVDASPSPTPARRASSQLRPGQIIGGGMTPSTSLESNMDAAGASALKSYDSVSEFNVPPSVSGDSINAAWAGARHTLGSELGSVFGDAAAPNMDDSDMRLSELGSPGGSAAKLQLPGGSAGRFGRTLRPMASNGSLRGDALAPSEAASDIADLRWSVASGSTVVGPAAPLLISGVPAEGAGTGISNDALMLPDIDAELLRQLSLGADGEWPDEHDELVPRGALRDQVMTSHESYDLLETATRKRPIHWADDDDFGKPITESDARKLGLLAAAQKSRRSLLGWVRGEPRKSSASYATSSSRKGKAREGLPASTSRPGGLAEIESAEQIEERKRTTDMLRQKRLDGLKARVQAGQLDANKAVMLGLGADDANSAEEHSLEQEVTRVALALTPARRRRTSRASLESTARKASSSKAQGTAAGAGAKEESSDDEAFEMLDLDPTRRRPRRGTDFYPVDRVARYKPSMVKQRVKVASNDAVSWATAWATFSMMVFFAFIVTFARGPKRVLGTPARQA